ncbi:MAG: hypothetical protein H6Q89_3953, partial [Myxococcaceae bacterium]|nr:hypothetical protein [Myxococcaceae bacterium]
SRLLDRVATETFAEGPRARPVVERMDEILRVICDAMDGHAAWMLLRVPDSNLLEVKGRAGALDDRILAYRTTVNADSIEGKIAARAEPMRVADLEQSALEASPALRGGRIRSVIGSPIWSGPRLRAVLVVGSRVLDRFSPRHARRIDGVAARLALLLEQSELWQELKNQSELVHQNEERLRLATAAAEIGVWELVPSTGKLTWDARSKQLWGLPADAEVNEDVFLAGIHPDDRPRIAHRIKELVEHPPGTPFQFEYRTVGIQDGIQRWISTHGKALFNEAGQVDRFLGVMRDISSARRVDELREQLFGIVGHDLRNPLSAIKMAAGLLQNQVAPKQLRTVAMINRCADRMNRMIHNLLDFTRVRFAGGVPLHLEGLNLASLCKELVGEAELANPQRQFRLSSSGDCSGTWDSSRLSEGLSNLIGNAVQHGAQETPIEVRVRGEGPDVFVEVHNQGVPIPAEVIRTIFDPFRSGSPTPGSGLGLGLYIVREIIAAHGGEIEVHSSNGAGTTFRVRLPRTPPDRAAAAPASLLH